MLTKTRHLELIMVLLFDTKELEAGRPKLLNAGQRICINQERAYWMRQYNPEWAEPYEQPEVIEEKISFVIQRIRDNDWYQLYREAAKSVLN